MYRTCRVALFSSVVAALLMFTASVTAAAPDAAESALEAKQAWSDEIRVALGFEDAAFWEGGETVDSPRKSGKAAVRWGKHTVNGGLECAAHPADLSAFNVLSFWLHSSHANHATFMIIIESNREREIFSYYSRKITVDWVGWKHFEIHFRSFGKVRDPAGWDRITRFRFTASGWGQVPTDESVWVFDEMDFSFTDKPFRPDPGVDLYVSPPPREDFLGNLRDGHPRLILLDEDLARIRDLVESDPRFAEWYSSAKQTAERLLRKPAREHELPDGRRLLSISRDVLSRLYHWGFFYRMEGERKWIDRAWKEMSAVADFPDWNPDHYLDTAEMMHAFAIGYDWFYNDFTESQRKAVRDALWRHGLRLSHAAYMRLDAEGMQGWRNNQNNWNFVCNGGTAVGAMAVLDELPEKCSEILHQAYQYIQIPIHHFEPDGAWWEGVGYWGYSMRYFAPYVSALESSFGTDFGLVEALEQKGLSRAGDFPIYLTGPLGTFYNFADSGSGRGVFQHPGLFFLAHRFRNPFYSYFQRKQTDGSLQDLIYYHPFEADLAVQDQNLDKYFRETELATMRSSWTDRNALFAGIKCGRNGIAHAHQDLGSFIFSGLGVKWFIDPGTERQTYLRHQHHLPKYHFYRIREEGHNTLVFDPEKTYCQDPHGESKITRFDSSSKEAFAIADLTHAYRRHAFSVTRGYRLFDHRRVFLVQDEIQAKKPGDIWWFAHAPRRVTITLSDGGREAVLEQPGRRCHVYLLAPAEAVFTVREAGPLPESPDPEIQNPNENMNKLAVHLTGSKDVTIAALFVPAYDFEPLPERITEPVPLAAWKLPDVKDPRLAEITVDGKPLADFSPEVYSYTVNAEPNSEELPALSAAAEKPDCAVETIMPSEIPGTARVSVLDKDEGTESLYLVRFRNPVAPSDGLILQRKSKPATVRGITVVASRDDGNMPCNVLDGDLETRWSANGTSEWIAFEFSKPRDFSQVGISWFRGDTRRARFEVSVSPDGQNWTRVFAGESSGETTVKEIYRFESVSGVSRLKITCSGNSTNLWNSITEVRF